MRKLISIIVPFYNEGKGVDEFYEALTINLQKCSELDFEVVCVDDGSDDDTLNKLIGICEKDARFHIIELSRNFGKEAALTAGIDMAIGSAIIPIDADLQDPPDLIPELIEAWQGGAEVVLARRIDRSSDSYLKRKTAEIFYRTHNYLSNINIPQDVGDYRLMDRVVIEALKQLPERQRFMKGLFAWVGYKTITIDYIRNPRLTGTTKFSGWKLWNFAIEGITGFSTVPLKIWTYIGIGGGVRYFYIYSFYNLKGID
jgi:glycosyltransferase involved in cell wall biosynthesis